MQKILLITRNLPPLVGGMERLNWHMADELKKYAEVKILGPKGAAQIAPSNVETKEAPLKPLPFFLIIAFIKSLWLALRWKPDVIIAGSGLTAPLAWLASKLCKARSAVYLHGFDITVKNKVYQKLWVPTFKKIDAVIVNSSPSKQFALAAGVSQQAIHIVHPGVSLPTQQQPKQAIAAFKKAHDLESKKILLSVGRLTTRKGLKEFVAQSLPTIVKTIPNSMLVIIGETPKNSLAAGLQTKEEILSAAKENQIEGHIKFLGVITDREKLATAYESADLHVFPVRDIPNDPEGFGMVAIEAAAHGLPTIAFASGGIIDAVHHGESGYLIEPSNYSALAQATIQVLIDDQHANWQSRMTTFAKKFAWPDFGRKLLSCLKIT